MRILAVDSGKFKSVVAWHVPSGPGGRPGLLSLEPEGVVSIQQIFHVYFQVATQELTGRVAAADVGTIDRLGVGPVLNDGASRSGRTNTIALKDAIRALAAHRVKTIRLTDGGMNPLRESSVYSLAPQTAGKRVSDRGERCQTRQTMARR